MLLSVSIPTSHRKASSSWVPPNNPKGSEEAPELDDESGCGVEPFMLATANNWGSLDKNIVTVTTE
jgi:hypothetical protein